MTVRESWKLPADGVAVTFCAASVPLARAHQTSASPDCALLRLASIHVSPAPLTVNVCLPAPAGPSDDTNATTRSFDPVVVKAGLDTAPEPSVEPEESMVTGPAVPGVTAFEGVDAGPVPMALTADTVKV